MPWFEKLPALGLYIHFPWCLRKCPYCDFNSHEQREQISHTAYVDALLADLEASVPHVWGRRIHSIFIGGGTPSLLQAPELDRLLSGVRAQLAVDPGAETTLELNPGSLEYVDLTVVRSAGVNRLSIGAQSFSEAQLRQLGRIHRPHEISEAFHRARRAGFDNINIDLMYGLPGQTIDAAMYDVQQAVALAPEHISYYQLTLEPNTYFHRYPPTLPDDASIEAIEHQSRNLLRACGYQRYEISAYAVSAKRCRHNINYWRFADYLGLGAGAHGKLSFRDSIVRTLKPKHPQAYMDWARAPSLHVQHTLEADAIIFEFLMNALRLTDGFDAQLFATQCGLPLEMLLDKLKSAQQLGLIEVGERINTTPRGYAMLDSVLQMVLPEACAQ